MVEKTTEFKIGHIRVLPTENSLHFKERNVRVAPKVMDTLCFLYESGDTVITREKLLQEVWADRYGGDESLTKAISELRKSLSQLLDTKAKFVTTVPKRGYKLELSLLSEHSNGISPFERSEDLTPSVPLPTAQKYK